MKSTVFALAATALFSVGSASHDKRHAHEAFHEKRIPLPQIQTPSVNNATCGCTTIWSTWYGEATLVPEPPAPSSTSVPTTSSAVASTSTPPAPSTTSSSTSVYIAPSSSAAPAPPPATSSAAPQSNPQPSPASNPGYSGNSAAGTNAFAKQVSRNGGLGMTYSPYQGDGGDSNSCKSSGQISDDIQQIYDAGFNTIRLYSTDCEQLQAVNEKATALGMRIIIGIFFNSAGSAASDFEDQMGDILNYFGKAGWSNIDLLTVGNEAISSGTADASTLSGFLETARGKMSSSGVPISTTLIVSSWQNSPSLCNNVDMLAVNIHPFFSDSTVDPSDSGSYVEEQMSLTAAACGNSKTVVVTESGWPSNGGTYKGQTAGSSQQQQAITSLRGSSKSSHIMYFANGNDMWKSGPNVEEYELYFGCIGQFAGN